jgi:hypothetical protein
MNGLNTEGLPSIDKEDFRVLKSGLGWDNDSEYRALLPYKFSDQTSFASTQYLCGNVYGTEMKEIDSVCNGFSFTEVLIKRLDNQRMV